MVSGFVAVAISEIEASLYFVDVAWRDGGTVRPDRPDRHIVRANGWSANEAGADDPTFYSRLAHSLHGASAAILVGDRPMVRRSGNAIFGHTTIRAQIGWCESEHVPCAVFTHCGSEVLAVGDHRTGALVRQIGRQRGIDAKRAYDGLVISLP